MPDRTSSLDEPYGRIDLRHVHPRGPRELLDGIKLLPRAIDKARAELAGTLGDYRFFGCALDEALFDALDVTAEQFLDVVRDATVTFGSNGDREALRDLRESIHDPGVVSDRQFLDFARSSEIDDAVVTWIRDTLVTPEPRLRTMNDLVETLAPKTAEELIAFEQELASSTSERSNIHTFSDLVDFQEERSA